MVAGSDLRVSDGVSGLIRGAAVGQNRQLKVSLFCGVGCYDPWSSSVLPAHAGMIRRWYVCPVPRCGFRTPVDAGRWSRDTLQVHLQLHYVAPTCPCCGKASEIAWDA